MQAKPNLSIIVAVAPDLAIGRRGDLLYHVSADLRRFKALTTGHTIIMGRRTFESLPKGALPDRRNIVISTARVTRRPAPRSSAHLTRPSRRQATTRHSSSAAQASMAPLCRLPRVCI